MALDFNSSPRPTLGVEVELQLIDRETRALTQAAPKLLEVFPDSTWVKKELLQSTVEINTEVCENIGEVESDLSGKLTKVRDVCDGLGVALVGAGTHPFSLWEDQSVSEDERYHRLVDRVQWPARRLLIFGLHVHVGVPSGEMSIALTNHLEFWLPHLLALSASSPFWEGKDTGLASARIKIFETLPTAGLPYRHRNWDEFAQLVDVLIKAKAIESIREIWWDVRPHPGFGTVEVRICDAMPTLVETVALAALIQALIVHLQKQIEEGAKLAILHPRIVKENRWRASRYSLLGSTIVDEEGRVEPISDSLEHLVEELRPVFAELESAAQIPVIQHMIRSGPSSARQRAIFEETGDATKVVDALIREAEENKPLRT
jgi:carboxylate-amine ligase